MTPSPGTGRVGRVVALAALGALASLVGAAPAAADPARPTQYRSTIDAVEPDLDVIEVEIIGGDAFIQLAVDRGHTAAVEGYDGEPYLRFLEDGTVQENRRSQATYLNADRYGRPGEVDMPPDVASGEAHDLEPDWRTVATDGRHAWHDHRVHWMSPEPPDGVEPGEVIQTQDVVLTVDGEPVTVTVSVTLAEPISPLPWLALGAVVGGGLVAVGWRGRSLAVSVVAAAVAAAGAVVVGLGELAEVPAGAGGSPLLVVIPTIGLLAALAAGVLLWRGAGGLAGVALLASAAALGGWAVLRLAVLFEPILPTALPAAVDRAVTTVAIAVAAAVAVLTFHSGVVAPAPLTDEE
jgi:hypothetical protein